MKHLLVIGGATATGKTRLAIDLARWLGTEILSADSRQFYREMSIGTAKPTPEELGQARHHFIDSLSVTQDYSVGDYERDALRVLDELYRRHDVAILVGGSGLFISAVCEGLDDFPAISPETKQWVQAGEDAGGLAWLQDRVAECDPVYFEQVDRRNPARLRRALQVCRESGRPYSSFRSGTPAPRPFTPHYLRLELPRPVLYARIDARVDAMLAAGLEDEVRRLLPFRDRQPLRTVGYSEWFDYFDGKTTRDEAIELIKQHSRNYAKRQATWFNKHGAWAGFDPDDTEGIFNWATEKLGPGAS